MRIGAAGLKARPYRNAFQSTLAGLVFKSFDFPPYSGGATMVRTSFTVIIAASGGGGGLGCSYMWLDG